MIKLKNGLSSVVVCNGGINDPEARSTTTRIVKEVLFICNEYNYLGGK